MTNKRLGLILAGLLALLLLAVGCEEKKPTGFFVPESSNLIAGVQVSKILADVDWEQVYADVPAPEGKKPPTLSDALNMVMEETGIDIRSFTQATVFAKVPEPAQPQDQQYVGAILLGTFEEAKFIQNIEGKAGEKADRQSFEGYTIYLAPDQEVGLAFVGKDWLIAGTPQALKDALSVAAGKKAALSGPILEAYDGLGSPLAKLALFLPDSLRQEMLMGMTGGDMPFDPGPLLEVDILAVSLDKARQDVSLLVKGRYPTAEAAQKARSVIEGARLLFSGLVPVPEVASFLSKIKIVQQESWVNLTLVATLEEVDGLVQALSQLGPESIPVPTP